MHRNLKERVRNLFKKTSPTRTQTVFLEYPVKQEPRYGYGKPPHPKLYELINRNREVYKQNLQSFLNYRDDFIRIKLQASPGSTEPAWQNGYLPGLDAVALYALLCMNRSRRYVEVGSGNSTKFVRRAIIDHGLPTTITSIDPQPRVGIDSLCDTVIRRPLEDVELGIFDQLERGDVLFVDGSHRVFMNSDVTVIFLDVLPRLKPGVLVQIHDICLPIDYPPLFIDRYYSEQYLLAAYLLAEGTRFDTLLPNAFISDDKELKSILWPLWKSPELEGIERHGGSYWIVMR